MIHSKVFKNQHNILFNPKTAHCQVPDQRRHRRVLHLNRVLSSGQWNRPVRSLNLCTQEQTKSTQTLPPAPSRASRRGCRTTARACTPSTRARCSTRRSSTRAQCAASPAPERFARRRRTFCSSGSGRRTPRRRRTLRRALRSRWGCARST